MCNDVPSPSTVGLVAIISSLNPPSRTRRTNASIVSCSGPIRSSGAIRAQQHVVQPSIHARLLQRHQVAGLLDHAQNVLLPAWIAANRTLFALRQIIALAAVLDVVFDVANRVGQRHRLVAMNAQNMIRQPLGRLLADAGQFGKLVDELNDGLR